MRKFYSILFAILFTSLISYAQNDPAAKKVIDAFGSKVKASNGIVASFTLNSFTSKGRAAGSKALSISMRGEKYLLKQGKTEIICDGKNVYNFDGNKTITKSSVEEGSQTLSPQKLLAGSYEKDFTYKLLPSTGAYNEIEMLPIDKRKNFVKVNLFFDKTKNSLLKARILDKSNNVTELKVNSFNMASSLNDNLFVFNKGKYPKDVEILD
ncbi:MAG: outer membrane lipoprotein carrier protein LolA [Sphingobacteriia bacterium]|nr:MAG: outer membrane lipoprotein carrier protein LolA [Sphingobacteriia bacterium]